MSYGGIICMNLRENIFNYQKGDEDCLEEIILKFNPLIEKYNRLFLYEDIRSELIIAIIESLKKHKLRELTSEGQLVKYVSIVLKNKYIDLVRKNKHPNFEITTENISNYETLIYDIENVESQLYFNDLIKSLTENQKWILIQIFVYQKTESEIAKSKGVTKQSIHNIKKQAFKKIKKKLGGEK